MFKDLDTGSDSNYLKLSKGENRVRLVSAPIALYTAFVDGKSKKFMTEEGVKAYNAKAPKEQQAKKRYALWVLDRATDEIILAEFGVSIMKAIKTLANDSDYGFDGLPPYDIKITKTGDGMDTEYTVLNLPAKSLTEDEIKRVEAQAKLFDFLKETAEDGSLATPF